MKSLTKLTMGAALAVSSVLAAASAQAAALLTIEGNVILEPDEEEGGSYILIKSSGTEDSPLYIGSFMEIPEQAGNCLADAESKGQLVRVTAPVTFTEDGHVNVESPQLKCELAGGSAGGTIGGAAPQQFDFSADGKVGYVTEAGMAFYGFYADGAASDEPELLGAPFIFDSNPEAASCLEQAANNDLPVHISANLETFDDGSQGVIPESLRCELRR